MPSPKRGSDDPYDKGGNQTPFENISMKVDPFSNRAVKVKPSRDSSNSDIQIVNEMNVDGKKKKSNAPKLNEKLSKPVRQQKASLPNQVRNYNQRVREQVWVQANEMERYVGKVVYDEDGESFEKVKNVKPNERAMRIYQKKLPNVGQSRAQQHAMRLSGNQLH